MSFQTKAFYHINKKDEIIQIVILTCSELILCCNCYVRYGGKRNKEIKKIKNKVNLEGITNIMIDYLIGNNNNRETVQKFTSGKFSFFIFCE